MRTGSKIRGFLVICSAVSCAFADQSSLPFTCVSSTSNTPVIRTEGLSELIGDIVLTCSGGAPIAAGSPVPSGVLTLAFNTAIANPPLFPNSGLNTALLLIGEPPPAAQVFSNPVPALNAGFQGFITGTGSALNFASGRLSNVVPGTVSNVNTVSFVGFPAGPPGGSGMYTIRATNLRVNASNLVPGTSITVSPTFTVPGLISFSGTPLVVAKTQTGLVTSFVGGAASNGQPFNYSLSSTKPALPTTGGQVLRFTEAFASAFKAKPDGPQDVPGQTYNSESGFLNPNLGVATQLGAFGTRLKAVFSGIPSGVNVYVSTANTEGTSTASASLVSSATTAGTTGLTQLTVTNGSATAIWEVQSADPNTIETFSFPVYFSFYSAGTPDTEPPAPSNISVRQSFDSPSGGAVFVAPYPFASAPILFTINSSTASGPQLFGWLDPRNCILGAAFPEADNACSPGQSPLVSVTSDSGLLTPSFSPATNSGISISGSFSGSTPVNGALQVSQQNGIAGAYQQYLTFTAPGSPRSLQIPLIVTILPPNGPVIRPGGVTDAFTFQSGSISPQQIFALFGLNFGPPNLVLGTLDSAGTLTSAVAHTQVLFDGSPAPLLYAAKNQLSGVAPVELAGKAWTHVQVVYNGLTSPPLTVPVTPASISIASADGSGGNGGVIINPDGTLNTAANPAGVGDTVVIYASYAGPFANGVIGNNGRTTTGPPYPAPAGPLSVTFGGIAATNIFYFGNAPTELESVMQINVAIPAGVKSGPNVPVAISAGGATSPPWTTIAIK